MVVDAIFGFGFKGDPRAPFGTILEDLSKCATPVVSVDVPSGWSVRSGAHAKVKHNRKSDAAGNFSFLSSWLLFFLLPRQLAILLYCCIEEKKMPLWAAYAYFIFGLVGFYFFSLASLFWQQGVSVCRVAREAGNEKLPRITETDRMFCARFSIFVVSFFSRDACARAPLAMVPRCFACAPLCVHPCVCTRVRRAELLLCLRSDLHFTMIRTYVHNYYKYTTHSISVLRTGPSTAHAGRGACP